MTHLTAQIPDPLYQQIEALAARENISIDQLVALALSAQISAWENKNYLQERAQRGSLGKLQ
jgi:hypothetical protein